MFKIDDAEWTLDLRREGAAADRLYKGPPKDEKADITLTCSDANFAALVMGKLNPQTVRRIINDCHACMGQYRYWCACMRLLVNDSGPADCYTCTLWPFCCASSLGFGACTSWQSL